MSEPKIIACWVLTDDRRRYRVGEPFTYGSARWTPSRIEIRRERRWIG